MGLSTNDGDANIAFLAEGNTFFKMLQKVDLEILGSCMYKFSVHRDRFGLLRLTIYQCYFFSYPTLLHVTNLDK